MAENKISEEVAQDQLQLVLDYYDIDSADVTDISRKKVLTSIEKKLVKCIRKGLLSIELSGEDLKITQEINNGKSTLNYCVMTGQNKVVMDDENNDNMYKRMFQLVSSLTNIPYNQITRLKRTDLSIAENLAMLFLYA